VVSGSASRERERERESFIWVIVTGIGVYRGKREEREGRGGERVRLGEQVLRRERGIRGGGGLS
jgi:hypothetical protein